MMKNNITELLSVIVKAMSEEGIELTNVELYEQAVELNEEVKVSIRNHCFLVYKVVRGGGFKFYSTDGMLDKVLELLKNDKWLPGDDIEAYGEWFTLVVEEISYYTPGKSEKYTNIHYRLLDENYSLSERMTLEDLKRNYTNVNLEQGRLK